MTQPRAHVDELLAATGAHAATHDRIDGDHAAAIAAAEVAVTAPVDSDGTESTAHDVGTE